MQLLQYTLQQLQAKTVEAGEKPYRAKQLWQWMLKGVDIDEMSNLPKAYRETVKTWGDYAVPQIEQKFVSADGTIKYLHRLSDGQLIESVVMDYEHGVSVCVSSQCGCRMGCKFCASNTGGLVRSLQISEMIGQIALAAKDTGRRIAGLVLMGIGEPLDNYDNVISFIRLISDEAGFGIGQRHISLSTCGIVPNINRLAKEDLGITLSISLHAVNDAERQQIMPIANKYSIDELMLATANYFDVTGRRISFEFTLIKGVNDDVPHAEALAKLMHRYFDGKPLHVNLIPVNAVDGRGFTTSPNASNFAGILNSRGINATIRRTLGSDISASCGQLRNAKRS